MFSELHKTKARQLRPLDYLISAAQTALMTMASTPVGTGRPDPAKGVNAGELTDAQKRESVRLMRVNHVGEVCAQALTSLAGSGRPVPTGVLAIVINAV